MRSIGQLEDGVLARRFGDHLYAQGVPNEVEAEANGKWVVWVLDDVDLQRAGEMLGRFRQNPEDPAYRSARKVAEEIRAAEKADEEAAARRVFGRKDIVQPVSGYSIGPLTFALIGLCIAVAMISKLGANEEAIQSLFISEFRANGAYYAHSVILPEVRNGEVWRLVTPMLIHFGILHIVFNMLALLQMGSLIEARQGSTRLLVLVLVIAVVSNLTQFWITRSPAFGGMSGVIYGLFGYMWIRGKFDPASGLSLDRQTIIMSLAWFAACIFGQVGHIANGAHAGGLVLGMIWGFFSAKAKWRLGKRG